MKLELLIPFYGPVDYLKQVVQSVIDQTDSDWSLRIVDDQYPSEEPAAWIRSLKDKRISYSRNDSNLGVTGNFNACVESSKAEWVVLVGGDDKLLPNYVAEAKRLIAMFPEAALIQPGVEVIDKDGAKVLPLPDRVKSLIRPKSQKPTVLSSEEALASLMLGNWLYFPSLIWRRTELLKHGFNPEYSIVQDLDVVSKILLDSNSLAYGSEVCFSYRRHSQSLSSLGGSGERYLEEAMLLGELSETLKSRGFSKAARRAKQRLLSRLAAVVDLLRGFGKLNRSQIKALLRHIFGL